MSDHRRLIATVCSVLSFYLMSVVPAFGWQQKVHYTMSIDLNTETHSYIGKQRLIYHNNSPDTLREVYYHLFYNAFKPGSRMDRRDQALPGEVKLGIDRLRPDQQGDVAIVSLEQNGTGIEWKVDETILRATLVRPLLPGDSTILEMEWETVIPRVRRRGGWMTSEGVEYSMSQWYPKLAEYDIHGWHPDEYIDREFYGVFGIFDVEITLPATYVLGATGRVVNPSEVGCGYQFTGRDTLLPYPASGVGRKTWKFHADNVHDFAWVADREYAHRISHWNGIPIHILCKRHLLENRRSKAWTYAADWTVSILDYFSRRFGNYAWPGFTVAQAGDGGMEYPMLIMVTGMRGTHSLFRVIAHEVGHQWYYGMMANNETQEAWLDEGLTQYLTDEADRAIYGEEMENPNTGLDRIVYAWDPSRWRDIHSYYELAVDDYDEPLDIFHDHFREEMTGRLVYYKGEGVVRGLQYMLGDSLFDIGMKSYYQRWRFRHPNARDFERAIEEASGLRLDWYFSQWIDSDRKCDYAFDDVSSERRDDGTWQTTVELSNKDEIVMPLDLTLTYDDGTKATANIPVEDWKKPGAAFHLPRWFWIDHTYKTTFITPKRVVCGEIDTSITLLDLDRTNNAAGTGLLSGIIPSSHVAFYRRWDLHRPIDRYSIRLRPTLWYSEADGLQTGFLADGGYAFDRYNAALGLYYNFKSGRVDYRAEYETPVDFLGRLGSVGLSATNSDGVQAWHAELRKELRPYFYQTRTNHTVRLFADHSRLLGGNYPNQVAPWDSGDFNTIGLGYSLRKRLNWRSSLSLDLRLEASVASRTQFEQWRLKGEWKTEWLGLGFTTSLFAGSSYGLPPAQRLFNAVGASSTSMHENRVHRLFMNVEPDFAARNHLILPTEGTLVSLTEVSDSTRFGRHLLNMKLQLSGLNPLKYVNIWPFNRIDIQPYAAGGWIFPDAVTFDDFSNYTLEAGAIGSVDLLALFFPRVVGDALDSPSPVRLSFIAPVWAVSPLLKEEGLRYRWGIGVSL